MPLRPADILPYVTPMPAPLPQRPSAWAELGPVLLQSISEGLEMRERRKLAQARMAQEQQQFDAVEGRMWSKQLADEAFDYHTLGVQGGQEEERAKALALAKRQEAQRKAAETVYTAVSSGRGHAVEALKPYLQTLGMEADLIDEEPPPYAPGLSAFSDPMLPPAPTGQRRRLLRMSADGQSLGEIDLEQIDQGNRAQVEPMLAELVNRARPMDRPDYEHATSAALASPGMMAEDPSKVFQAVTGMAQRGAGEAHSDERARLMREQSAMNNAASLGARASAEQRQEQKAEAARRTSAGAIAQQEVKNLMQSHGVKDMLEQQRKARAARDTLNQAVKSGSTIDGAVAGKLGLVQVVTSYNGKNSSNMEWREIVESSFGMKLEEVTNKYFKAGAIPPDKLNAFRNVVNHIYMKSLEEHNAVADAARQNVWANPLLQMNAPDMIEQLGQHAARQVLGARAYARPPVSSTDLEDTNKPGSALQNQADAMRDGDDISSEVDGLLGDWSPDARP